jgi:hypothetical protein
VAARPGEIGEGTRPAYAAPSTGIETREVTAANVVADGALGTKTETACTIERWTIAT